MRQAGFEPVERRDPFSVASGEAGARELWMVVARRK